MSNPHPSLWAFEFALELWVEAHSRTTWIEARHRMAAMLDKIVEQRIAKIGASPEPADEDQSGINVSAVSRSRLSGENGTSD